MNLRQKGKSSNTNFHNFLSCLSSPSTLFFQSKTLPGNSEKMGTYNNCERFQSCQFWSGKIDLGLAICLVIVFISRKLIIFKIWPANSQMLFFIFSCTPKLELFLICCLTFSYVPYLFCFLLIEFNFEFLDVFFCLKLLGKIPNHWPLFF